MRKTSIILALFSLASAVSAQDAPIFQLTLPVGYGDVRAAEICVRATLPPDTTCDMSSIVDPVSGLGVDITTLKSTGRLEQIKEQFAGDFVPWPWSRGSTPEGLELSDFAQFPSIPVLLNPCTRMLCAEGTICVWDPEKPIFGAVCKAAGNEAPVAPLSPFGWDSLPPGALSLVAP